MGLGLRAVCHSIPRCRGGSQPRPYTEGCSYSRPAAVRPYISPRRRIRWTEIL